AAARQLGDQGRRRRAGVRLDVVAVEQVPGQCVVARSGQQQQNALLGPLAASGAHGRSWPVRLLPGRPAPTGWGTPVRTPAKSRSGWPTRTPLAVKVSSRMVRSCAPVRFLRTDNAWRTWPSASK